MSPAHAFLVAGVVLTAWAVAWWRLGHTAGVRAAERRHAEMLGRTRPRASRDFTDDQRRASVLRAIPELKR